MGVKMNLRILMKSQTADSEIGLLRKSISNHYGCATAMPTAWELKKSNVSYLTDATVISA